MKKVTWNKIRKDFKYHYPNLHKLVIHWQPHGYAEIELYLITGDKLVYNYDQKRARILETWKGHRNF